MRFRHIEEQPSECSDKSVQKRSLARKFTARIQKSKGVYEGSDQRGTCIKGLFWPPLEPNTENCFSPISFGWFIRRITEV